MTMNIEYSEDLVSRFEILDNGYVSYFRRKDWGVYLSAEFSCPTVSFWCSTVTVLGCRTSIKRLKGFPQTLPELQAEGYSTINYLLLETCVEFLQGTNLEGENVL